jgi:transcriptional regulator with XRE-family HTH domain
MQFQMPTPQPAVHMLLTTLRENGYSNERLASTIGVSQSTVFRWQTGRTVPTRQNLDVLKRLCANCKAGGRFSNTFLQIPKFLKKGATYVPESSAEKIRRLMHFIMWALNGNETALAQDLVNIETRQRADQPHVSRWLAGDPIPIWVARAVQELALKAKDIAQARVFSIAADPSLLLPCGIQNATEISEAIHYVCSFKNGTYGILTKNEAEREARRIVRSEINWALLGLAPAREGELNILSRVTKLDEDVDAHYVVVLCFGRRFELILVQEKLATHDRYARALDEINVHVRKMVLDSRGASCSSDRILPAAQKPMRNRTNAFPQGSVSNGPRRLLRAAKSSAM